MADAQFGLTMTMVLIMIMMMIRNIITIDELRAQHCAKCNCFIHLRLTSPYVVRIILLP